MEEEANQLYRRLQITGHATDEEDRLSSIHSLLCLVAFGLVVFVF